MTSITLRKTHLVALLHDNAAQQNIALGLAMDWVNDFGDESQKEAVTKCCATYRNYLKDNELDVVSVEKTRNDLLRLLEEIETFLSEKTPSQQAKNVLVALQNIRKSYQKNSFTLHDLSLEFRQGEITGIVGANANGKSTLVKIIVGEHLQDGGTLRFPHWQGNDKSFSWQRIKQKIAYLPQELTPWSGSLRENLAFEATAHGIFGKSNTIAVDYIIERLSLSDYVNATWQELSGGYKLRYALAKALVWQPELLILDEPLANLDINAQLVVLADLKAMTASEKHPVGVILTSQHIHEVELVADQIIVLDKGILKYAGIPNTFENATQEHIFEFHSILTINELKDKLHIFPIREVKQKGAYFILQVPNSVSAAQFLSYAAAQDIRLSYFRDISYSVKQLFL